MIKVLSIFCCSSFMLQIIPSIRLINTSVNTFSLLLLTILYPMYNPPLIDIIIWAINFSSNFAMTMNIILYYILALSLNVGSSKTRVWKFLFLLCSTTNVTRMGGEEIDVRSFWHYNYSEALIDFINILSSADELLDELFLVWVCWIFLG